MRRSTLREAAQGFGDVLCQLKLTRIPRQDSQASLELEAGEDDEGRERQIRMLKCRRGKLLDNIHSEQKLLDQIDFIIREKKKEADRIF